MKKTTFICQLSERTQKEIENELIDLGLSSEDVQNALDSRLCDLSDTIDIVKYL